MQKLSALQAGQRAVPAGIQGNARFLTRGIANGLTVGSFVEMLRNEKKMPLLLSGRDSVVALNRDESANILVTVAA